MLVKSFRTSPRFIRSGALLPLSRSLTSSSQIVPTNEICDAQIVEHWSTLKNINDSSILFNSLPDPFILTKLWSQVLEGLHSTGLEWWAVVPLAAMGLRLAVTPLMLLQTKFWVKRRRLQRHLESAESAWLATDLPEKERYFRIYSMREKRMKQYRITWTRYWISPFIQITNFLCFARAIRRIGIQTSTLSTEGILWFQNLCVPDAYQILPFLSATLIFCHIHYRPFETLFNEMIQKADNVPERKGITIGVFRLPEQINGADIIAYLYFGLFLVWTHSMPSVMCLYLIPSFLWRLGYCAVIRNSPNIQKKLGFTLDPFIPLSDRSDFPLPKEFKPKKRVKG